MATKVPEWKEPYKGENCYRRFSNSGEAFYQQGSNFFDEAHDFVPIDQLPEWMREIISREGIKPIAQKGKVLEYACPVCRAGFEHADDVLAHMVTEHAATIPGYEPPVEVAETVEPESVPGSLTNPGDFPQPDEDPGEYDKVDLEELVQTQKLTPKRK